MSENKKNPLITLAAGALPGVIKTVVSLIQDKKKASAESTAAPAATIGEEVKQIAEQVKDGVQLSSKRLLNVVGTGVIVTFALSDMGVNGITKMNLIVLGMGALYSLGISLVSYLSEKK